MKRSIKALLFFLPVMVLISNLTAQRAKIVFKAETLEAAGMIQEGEVADYLFVFDNTGDADLQIFDLQPSCGCTAAVVSASTIPPGKTGSIKASIDTLHRVGPLEKSLVVISNDPLNPQKILKMKGVVKNFHKEAGTNFKPEAIFSEGCSSCHADRAKGKSGAELYQAVCKVCHKQGKSAIPLDVAWIRQQKSTAWQGIIGKGGKSMPGFASAHKGPLDKAQIAGLTQYLKDLEKTPAPTAPAAKAGK
jgi:mono/diheme cytochrome c family protein